MLRFARPALAIAGALTVCVVSAASAAPAGPTRLVFADKAGDSLPPQASTDITKVSFATTGKGIGKKYAPKYLVVELTLSGPPSSTGTTLYEVDTELTGCGSFSMSYSPGAKLIESSGYASCGGDGSPTGSGTLFDALPEVKGSTLIWTFALKALPGNVRRGSTFTALSAHTALVDPVTGLLGPAAIDPALSYDNASTDATYTVG